MARSFRGPSDRLPPPERVRTETGSYSMLLYHVFSPFARGRKEISRKKFHKIPREFSALPVQFGCRRRKAHLHQRQERTTPSFEISIDGPGDCVDRLDDCVDRLGDCVDRLGDCVDQSVGGEGFVHPFTKGNAEPCDQKSIRAKHKVGEDRTNVSHETIGRKPAHRPFSMRG